MERRIGRDRQTIFEIIPLASRARLILSPHGPPGVTRESPRDADRKRRPAGGGRGRIHREPFSPARFPRAGGAVAALRWCEVPITA